MLPGTPLGYNLSKEEWSARRHSAEDQNVMIRSAVEGSCVVVWDNETYESNNFKDADLVKLVEKSNSIFHSFRKRKVITEEELRYFTYKYKKVTKFGKMYQLPKIHKCLVNVPGSPVISNCDTATDKASEFLYHLYNLLRGQVCLTLRTLINFCRILKT